MTCWKVACLLLVVVVRLAQPRCYICEQRCYNLLKASSNLTKIYITCEEADHYNDLVSFIDKNNFTNLKSLALKSPALSNLNLTKFYNVSELNFSENNVTYFNFMQFNYTKFINLSHNSISVFPVVIPNLTQLDLSYNLIAHLPQSVLQPNKLSRLNLENNLITNLSTISSNSLKYLCLSNNKIEKLELGHCPSIKELTLSNNFIKRIQQKLFIAIPNVEKLNLSSNYLIELEDYYFNLTNLLSLDLKNNKIYSLSQKCFFGLNRLQVLDISSNKINTVSPSTFQYLNGLFHLEVSQNKELSTQDFALLLATRRLKSVYASKTNQKKIPSSLTRSVRYLVLSFNNISQIQCGDLDSYPLLNGLDLANNNISYIEDDALGRLELLTTINLDNNFLTSVPHTLPNNLRYLFLKRNNIKSISNNDFTGLHLLTHLDLSFNVIHEVKDDSFSQLYGLEKLNLSGNQIVTFSSNSFSGLQNLKRLDLSYLTVYNQDLLFPVPDYNQLQELLMKNSSVLVSTFMKDSAALKTFEQLSSLDISNSNIKFIRKDFPSYLPRLTDLNIQGNPLDCDSMEQIFIWSRLKETGKCSFIISEKRPRDRPPPTIAAIATNNENFKRTRINKDAPSKDYSTVQNTSILKDSKGELKRDQYFENKSDLFNITNLGTLSNELWLTNSSSGIVDAYSSEMPTSHPGLFVLLLLPIAVVSTCLFLNYSRIKRSTGNINPTDIEMDIEISNISSELW